MEINDQELDIDIEDLAKLTQQEEPVVKFNPVSKKNLEWYYGNLFPFKQFYKWELQVDWDSNLYLLYL